MVFFNLFPFTNIVHKIQCLCCFKFKWTSNTLPLTLYTRETKQTNRQKKERMKQGT